MRPAPGLVRPVMKHLSILLLAVGMLQACSKYIDLRYDMLLFVKLSAGKGQISKQFD